jgi:WD40 repeat protein
MEQPLDVAWMNDTDFVICGGDFMLTLRLLEGVISRFRKYETREDHALLKVTYDWRSQLTATASESGMIDIWDPQGQCNPIIAHQGLITCLIWQPMQTSALVGDDVERLLASSGDDGIISIWSVRASETKPICSMTMDSAVVALAFTPDGAFIAGATSEQILIWKVDDANIPRASWTRGSEPGWQTPRSNDSVPEEDHHCLCWDAHGQKLAYGVNSLLAVINFRR